MRCLITGITGFVGSWLAEKYLEKDVELFGIRTWRNSLDNVAHIANKIKFFEADITDAHSVFTVIDTVKPDIIHHLAAQSFVPASWQNPVRTFEVNVLGSINLFEAVRRYCPKAIVQIASSSEVYGKQQEMPITEKALPKPCSPYGVSKLAMDRLSAQYYYSYGLNIVITRAFNHTGPRRPEQFVCSSFAKQIVEMEKELREVITVGNLDAKRDFTDVRDICDAYILSVEKCKFGEPYNICSGTTHKIREVLSILCSLSNVKVKTGVDPKRLRPSDLPVLQGRNTKFIEVTGWHPQIPFKQTMADLLDYWRAELG